VEKNFSHNHVFMTYVSVQECRASDCSFFINMLCILRYVGTLINQKLLGHGLSDIRKFSNNTKASVKSCMQKTGKKLMRAILLFKIIVITLVAADDL
jgi:hypothetical protein